MENTETTEKKGFIATCASDDGAGVFAFIYVLFAIGCILSIVIFG